MPFLKMYISGELVDAIEISFAGLVKDERPAHVEGLVQWIKNKNYVPAGEHFEIFLEGIQSEANKLIKADAAEYGMSLIEFAARRLKMEPTPPPRAKRIKNKPFKNIQKSTVEKATQLPFERPKGEYSNKQWLDEV